MTPKKVLAGGLAAILGGAAALFAFGSTMPADYLVRRDVLIAAPAARVWAEVADLRAWEEWSPWRDRDPTIRHRYAGADRGVGQTAEWSSERSGNGQLRVTGYELGRRLVYEMTVREWRSVSEGEIELVPESDATTRVRWSMRGRNSPFGRVLWRVLTIDRAVGADFESGLARLRARAERP